MTEQHEPEMDRFRDDVHRALFKASGEVSESGRFEQFLYLLMRDHTNTGVVGEALLRTFYPSGVCTPEWAASYYRTHPEMFVPAERLVDQPNERHLTFFVQLCTLCRHGESSDQMPNVIAATLKNTPGDDEVVGFISNGWLMSYCRFVANCLRDGLPT